MEQSNDKTTLGSYDRAAGMLKDLPDVISVKPATVPIIPTFGIGTHTYIVQTYRRKEEGDYIFFQDVSDGPPVRLVIPPKIANIISRQREQLNTKSRRRASRQSMQDRMARGEKPGFLKKSK